VTAKPAAAKPGLTRALPIETAAGVAPRGPGNDVVGAAGADAIRAEEAS
jgi:hypothetical protein